MAKITPEQLAKSGTEQALQTAYFAALADLRPQHPCLEWAHAIPNGGERNIAVASRMKASGARSGVWDVCLPFPRGGHPFAYIEFKVPAVRGHKNGGCSDEQVKFGNAMAAHGAFLRVVYGWEEALKATLDYLAMPAPGQG